MTAEEFLEFVERPENEERFFELVRGEVIGLSRPKLPQGVVCGNTGRILGNYTFARRKGYVASNDTGVILERDPDTVRGPDLAYFEGARTFADVPDTWAVIPPRLVVEILSPNDRADQVNDKLTDYLDNGVELVWIVDPSCRTITVYTRDSGPRVFNENDILTGRNVLPGFRCKVADFFFMPEEAEEKKPRPVNARKSNHHSTVTLFARFLGLSTLHPRMTAAW
jgi:Uma2 family endonuclease